MRLKNAMRLALVIGVLLIGACGSDDADETTATTAGQDTATTTAAPGSGGGAAGDAVLVKNTSFTPASLATTVGGKVTWTFADAVKHTVSADDGSFKSGEKDSGTFEHTFDRAGTFAYHCDIHPFMKGTITIT